MVWDTETGKVGQFDCCSNANIVVGNAVYTGGLDINRRNTAGGAVAWRRTIAAPAASGDGYSGLAYNLGIVVAVAPGRSKSTLVALDANTGAVIWRRKLPGISYSSLSIVNNVVYVGIDNDEVMAVQLASGSVNWTWATPVTGAGPGTVSSPTTDGKAVYVTTDDGTVLRALDAHTGEQRWSQTIDSGNEETGNGFTPSLMGGHLYVGTASGSVYSVDAATGAVIWQVGLGGGVARPVLATSQAIITMPSADYSDDQITARCPRLTDTFYGPTPCPDTAVPRRSPMAWSTSVGPTRIRPRTTSTSSV